MLENSPMQPCVQDSEFGEHSWESLRKQRTAADSLYLHYIKDIFFFQANVLKTH